MRRFLIACLALTTASVSAQTMYKCQVNGKIEYSDKPCFNSNEVKRIAPDGGPTPEDRARALMRLNAERARFDAIEKQAWAERAARANEQMAQPSSQDIQRAESEARVANSKAKNATRDVEGRIGNRRDAKAAAELTQGQADVANVRVDALKRSADGARVGSESDSPAAPAALRTKGRNPDDQEVFDVESSKEYSRERVPQQASSPKVPSSPSSIKSCGSTGCSDTMGKTYMGDPGGSTFIRTDGATCQRIGALLQCN